MTVNHQVWGVIFDLDGTLMNSSLDFAQIREAIGCQPQSDILAYVSSLGEKEQIRVLQIIEQFELDDAKCTKALPGAQICIDYLHCKGIPKAVLTRNCRLATRQKLSVTDWQFDPVLSREDAQAKPSADGLLKIARYWGIPCQQVVYIGDYRYDIEAAVNAGMIACLYAPQARPEYADNADYVFRHWLDFTRWLKQHHINR